MLCTQTVSIYFILAQLNGKQEKRLVKAIGHCEMVIKAYDKYYFGNARSRLIRDCVPLIETLNLLSDISVSKIKDYREYDYLLENAMRAYKLVWEDTWLNTYDLSKFLSFFFFFI